MDNPTNAFKKRVRQRLSELNLSERELAAKAGLSPAAVNKILGTAGADPRLSSFVAICEALGIRAPEVFSPAPSSIEDRVSALEARLTPAPQADAGTAKARLVAFVQSLSEQDADILERALPLLPLSQKPGSKKASGS